MKTICALIPCLMLDNNRAINRKSIQSNIDSLKFDAYVVYDQMFSEEDFNSQCIYIGHADKRMGWVEPRNKLLEYFYNSDYDYAFWIDANSVPSKTTLNDLSTIIDNIRIGRLDECDSIFATLGMWVSQDRIACKDSDDYLENVHLLPCRTDRSYNWMHGLFHKNFKKYYNQEFYIDERCDTRKGTPDDVYFARLLRKFTNCWVAPTVVINKPSSKMSCTWANEKGTYDYPPVLFDVVDDYILESSEKSHHHLCNKFTVPKEIVLERNNFMRSLIKPYQPRGKKKASVELNQKVSLF